MDKLERFSLLGIIFVSITGTVWHFIYRLSGCQVIVGLFSPVNESTWEHMKLCFFPMLIYSLYMNRRLKKEYPCVTSALLSGILSGTLLIPVLFYTYTGILGFHVMALDIATFLISILSAFGIVYRLSASCRLFAFQPLLKLLVLLLALCFFLFTYYPPDIGIFFNPAPASSLCFPERLLS